MASDPLLRATKRARQLPPGARCVVCGSTERLVASKVSEQPVLCQDHHRQRRGVSQRDIAHVARRRSWGSLTVVMPTSANQEIEDMRRDLGLADSPDPMGDPFLIEADYHEGRALIDLLLARHRRNLAAFLRAKFGDRYWDGGPQAPIV